VVDTAGYTVCAVTWAEGCGDAPAPEGFTAESTVGELCELACAFYLLQRGVIRVDNIEGGEAAAEAS